VLPWLAAPFNFCSTWCSRFPNSGVRHGRGSLEMTSLISSWNRVTPEAVGARPGISWSHQQPLALTTLELWTDRRAATLFCAPRPLLRRSASGENELEADQLFGRSSNNSLQRFPWPEKGSPSLGVVAPMTLEYPACSDLAFIPADCCGRSTKNKRRASPSNR